MDELSHFHFLRPWVLLLIPCLILLLIWLRKQSKNNNGFEQWIDPHLLQHLTTPAAGTQDHNNGTPSRYYATKLPYALLIIAWVISCIALAGPTWKQLPQALHQSEQAMIVILDLSPSMLAQDNKPSRIVRARLKIKDLLSQRKGGLTALVVYAGEAHVVTPLTDDIKTIINLLATLEPGLLPIPGSNIEMAVELALQLAEDSGLQNIALTIVTDGIAEEAVNTVSNTVNKNTLSQRDVFILGIGTEAGAPIPAATSNRSQPAGFLRDKNNQIIHASRNEKQLQQLADLTNGYYLPLQANDSDIQFILRQLENQTLFDQETLAVDRKSDQWHEFGPTLLLFCLPFFALMFRRGWLLQISIIVPLSSLSLSPQIAEANPWNNLWMTKDQQGQQAFQQEKYEAAQSMFNNPQWKGSAAYKNKDYETALNAFSQGDSATDHYNRGNALSQLGRYDEAIEAYDTALEKDPNLSDAKKNKDIIEQLKEQQDPQSSDSNDSNENNERNEKNEQQENNKNGYSDNNADSNNQSPENSKSHDHSEHQQQQKESEESHDQTPAQHQESDNNDSKSADDKNDANAQKNSQAQAALPKEQQDTLAHLSKEERQELEQWLRKVPDDPSGLLRRKFEYEFQKRRQLYQNGQWSLPDNNAHQRY